MPALEGIPMKKTEEQIEKNRTKKKWWALICLALVLLAAAGGYVFGRGAPTSWSQFLTSVNFVESMTALLSNMAWPIAVVTVALIFRKPIAKKIEEIEEVGIGNSKTKMAKRVTEAAENVVNSAPGSDKEQIEETVWATAASMSVPLSGGVITPFEVDLWRKASKKPKKDKED